MSEDSILEHGYASAEIDVPTGEYALSDARAKFPALVNQAAEEGLRVIITRHGKPAAAIVPIRDLERLRDADSSAREGLLIATGTNGEVIDTGDDMDFAAQPTAEIIDKLENVFRAALTIPELQDRFSDLSNIRSSPASETPKNPIQPERSVSKASHV